MAIEVLAAFDRKCRDGGCDMNGALWEGLPAGLLLKVLTFLPLETALGFQGVCKTWNTYIRSAEFLREQVSNSIPRPGPATVSAVVRGPTATGTRGMDLSFLPEVYSAEFRCSDPNPGWKIARQRYGFLASTAATRDGYVLVAVMGPEEREEIPLRVCVFSPITKTYRELPVLNLASPGPNVVRLLWDVQVTAAAAGGFKVFVIHHVGSMQGVSGSVYRSELNRWTAGHEYRLDLLDVQFWVTHPRLHPPYQIVCSDSGIYYVEPGWMNAYFLDVRQDGPAPESSTWYIEGQPGVCVHRGTLYSVHRKGIGLEIWKLDQSRGLIWTLVADEHAWAVQASYDPDLVDLTEVDVVGDMICIRSMLGTGSMLETDSDFGPDNSGLNRAERVLVVQEWLCFHLVQGSWATRKVASWADVGNGETATFLFEFRAHWL